MKDTVEEKSFQFAVRIVNLYRYLKSSENETALLKQLLRSGTSVGANIAEAQQAQSRPDFVSKLSIALKEANETDYWLRLLRATQFISEEQFASLIEDCKEIEKMLTAIIKTTKSNR